MNSGPGNRPVISPADPAVTEPTVRQRAILAPIYFYRRFLSPLKAHPSCRFSPTGSHYAVDAILAHGAFRGLYLALRRILKCHPFHPGGFDPVPSRRHLEP